ncbi:type II and III secretion system protein family protein [Bowmanella pacifica]|uniref:Pilus assembly protein CpaC n=1 Tax=Bowmanella pacifica TaxID=502051 RepID=A0A917YRQ5_9ALTE|nr:type II and III secretion system protein family protein [Bowmanella pacifica]GGO65084.1 pilus assembly protein CpaC [Bowmanella pacifica]
MYSSKVGVSGIALWVLFGILFLYRLLVPDFAYAGGPLAEINDTVRVPIYKSRNLPLQKSANRVSVGNPEIADILILRSKELYIVGKALGTTNVMIWDEQDALVDVVNLEVTHDLLGLREHLHTYLPGEDIGVYSSQGQLVLSGQASSLGAMTRATELAQGFSDAASTEESKSRVLNMLSVGGAQQVMLEVVVAEVSTELSRTFDSNFQLLFSGSDAVGGLVNGSQMLDSVTDLSSKTTSITSTGSTSLSSGAFGSYLSGDMLINFSLDIAKRNGLAKILAEPNITALSGQKAQFLSGGEYPVPVPSREGTTIQYRDFGVGVSFLPTVLDSGKINLNLKVLVSELSNNNAVGITPIGSTASLVIPSIVKRTSETTVELGDGQTIAISGLLSDNLRERVDKLPGLGDVPILGQLFRSQQYVNGQSELVIMVTPRLVRPFNKQGVKLPTDGFVPSTDLEFYLLGKTSGHKGKGNQYAPSASNPEHTGVMHTRGTQEQYGHEVRNEGEQQ